MMNCNSFVSLCSKPFAEIVTLRNIDDLKCVNEMKVWTHQPIFFQLVCRIDTMLSILLMKLNDNIVNIVRILYFAEYSGASL